jgi:ATP-dependent protease ClpP protease subunit
MTSKWYAITKTADSAEIEIFDEIGFGGVSAKEFCDELRKIQGKHINLRINSPGGSIADGEKIIATLRRNSAGFTAWVEGLAASMASVIACAADKCFLTSGSLMMIHRASTISMGDADSLRKDAEVLEKCDKNILRIYAKKTGLDFDTLAKMIADETWMDAEEALRLGFSDGITENTPAMAHLTPASMRAKFDTLLASMAKTNKPANEAPAEETQVIEIPAVDAPVVEAPAEVVAEEVPAVEVPAVEIPAEEPAPEVPAEEPVVETAEGTITPEVIEEPVALASDSIVAKFDALKNERDDFKARWEASEARAEKAEAKIAATSEALANLERSLGIASARIVPAVAPVSEPVKSAKEVFEEITDPTEKAKFFKKNRAEILGSI